MEILEFKDRVNILLGFGEELRGMTQRSSGDGWSPEEYQGARTAAARVERGDFIPREPEPSLVRGILQALARQERTRGALGIAAREATTEPTYLSLQDLGEVGPPPEIPFLISEIGVLSVPAPASGDEGAQLVRDAVKTVSGLEGVEPAVSYYTLDEMPPQEQATTFPLGYPVESYLEAEEKAEWFEAALEAGVAAETLPWGVVRVNAPRAWVMPPGFFGQGIRVAVVDTGVGPHIDLPVPLASATFVPGTTSANDDHGHGTHVAGTVLARRNGRGVIGVAPRALLMRAKVLSRSGSGQDSWVAAGIVWAVNNGARIINLSLGSSASSMVIDRAVAYARSRRVTICAAAGNHGSPPVGHPARNPLCIAVAATDQNNRRAAFSARGPELDLSAPGVQVLSTWPGNAYRLLNGTSMATPHVAGVAAIVLSKRPALDPVQLQRILERTAIPLGPVTDFGRGLVQADRAVAIAVVPSVEEMVEEITAGISEIPAERRELVGAAAPGQRGQRQGRS